MLSANDKYWMQQALMLAEQAASAGEVPVGALLIKDDQILAATYNQPIKLNDPCAHAEILALRAAGQKINNYRLINTTLYVTLEPCMMCAAALVHARVARLVFGAYDQRAGAVSSCLHALEQPFLNHKVQYAGGLYAEQSKKLLQAFFKARR